MSRIVISCVIAALCAASASRAEIPRTLDYQGVLTEGGISAVPDGDYEVVFRIYDAASGGTPLWEEIQTVEVTKGIFDATLGCITTLDLPFDEQYYLGISVEGEAELSPRVVLAAAPYSLNARGVSGQSNVFPPAGDVGVGTTTPAQKLAVAGGIEIANTETATSGTIRFNGGDFEGFDGSVWKSFTDTGVETLPSGSFGQTLRHDGSEWEASGLIYNDGTFVGIGTNGPTHRVHIAAEGDPALRIEAATAAGAAEVRLDAGADANDNLIVKKNGPSASGSVAGLPAADLSQISTGSTAGGLALHVASAEPMHFATNDLERMRLDWDGALTLFGTSHRKVLRAAENAGYGGTLHLFDDALNEVFAVEADEDGEGAYLGIQRDAGSLGFVVDGNTAGSNNTAVSIYGADRSTHFNMNQSGNSAVQLPGSSISDIEIIDEPGVASYAEGAWPVEITTGHTIVGIRSIVAPTAGYVLAVAGCGVELSHTTGTESNAMFGVSDTPADLPANQENSVMLDAALPTGDRQIPIGCHGLFEVTSAGTHTFYFLGQKTSGTFHCHDIQLSLVFIPTAYGDVNPTAASGTAPVRERTAGMPVTGIDVQRERAAAEASQAERVERELAAIREEIAKLKRETGNTASD